MQKRRCAQRYVAMAARRQAVAGPKFRGDPVALAQDPQGVSQADHGGSGLVLPIPHPDAVCDAAMGSRRRGSSIVPGLPTFDVDLES